MNNNTNYRRFSNRRFSRPSFSRAKRQPKRINPALFVKTAATNTSEDVYKANHTFADFGISQTLLANIQYKGYDHPTPIQDQAIPHLMQGRDVIGIANTGTGKTAAFLIPLIHKIQNDLNHKALVIVPTRELALQIQEEFMAFTHNMRLFSVLIIGGANMQRQRTKLLRNYNIVIATPGRLFDHINKKTIRLYEFESIVLDEVDRMVDIGFINDVKKIIAQLPQKRQSLFFSATVGDKENSILQSFVNDPIRVSVSTQPTVETGRSQMTEE